MLISEWLVTGNRRAEQSNDFNSTILTNLAEIRDIDITGKYWSTKEDSNAV